MKIRHDPDTGIRPLLAAAAATVAIATVVTLKPATPTNDAMKMHHDCCVLKASATK